MGFRVGVCVCVRLLQEGVRVGYGRATEGEMEGRREEKDWFLIRCVDHGDKGLQREWETEGRREE